MLTVRVVCHLLVLTTGSLQQSQNTQHSDKSEKAKPFMEGHGEVLNHQPDWMEMQDQSHTTAREKRNTFINITSSYG